MCGTYLAESLSGAYTFAAASSDQHFVFPRFLRSNIISRLAQTIGAMVEELLRVGKYVMVSSLVLVEHARSCPNGHEPGLPVSTAS
jgi:hypothetical protein